MGRRGPRAKTNVERKWWRIHKITLAQIEDVVAEIKAQLPLLENSITPSLVISCLVSRLSKEIEDDLFDAAEFVRHFHIGDEDEDEDEVARKTTSV